MKLKNQSTGIKSNGIYSVMQDKWIKEPVADDIPEINKEVFNKLYNKWEDKYFDVIETKNIEKIDDFIEDIYDLRKESLANEGEYGLGNLVFKELRNLGFLDNLKDLKCQIKSKQLSLESVNEQLDINKYSTKQILKVIKSKVDGDGTYSIDKNGKLRKENLKSGYQTSFFRDEIEDNDIQDLAHKFERAFGEPYLGIFDEPEISFSIKDKNVALDVAKIFNQHSIWDNAQGKGIKNVAYDSSAKVDYTKATKEFVNYINKLNTKDKTK